MQKHVKIKINKTQNFEQVEVELLRLGFKNMICSHDASGSWVKTSSDEDCKLATLEELKEMK